MSIRSLCVLVISLNLVLAQPVPTPMQAAPAPAPAAPAPTPAPVAPTPLPSPAPVPDPCPELLEALSDLVSGCDDGLAALESCTVCNVSHAEAFCASCVNDDLDAALEAYNADCTAEDSAVDDAETYIARTEHFCADLSDACLVDALIGITNDDDDIEREFKCSASEQQCIGTAWEAWGGPTALCGDAIHAAICYRTDDDSAYCSDLLDDWNDITVERTEADFDTLCDGGCGDYSTSSSFIAVVNVFVDQCAGQLDDDNHPAILELVAGSDIEFAPLDFICAKQDGDGDYCALLFLDDLAVGGTTASAFFQIDENCADLAGDVCSADCNNALTAAIDAIGTCYYSLVRAGDDAFAEDGTVLGMSDQNDAEDAARDFLEEICDISPPETPSETDSPDAASAISVSFALLAGVAALALFAH